MFLPKTTNRVLEAAIGNKSRTTVDLVPSLLKHCNSTEVTEDLLQIASSVGKEDVPQQLSNKCVLHHVQERWLDQAQFFNVAASGTTETLKD